MAEVGYMSVAPHNPNGPLAIVQNAHLAATIPNFLILETIGSPDFLRAASSLRSRSALGRHFPSSRPAGAR